MTLCFCLNSIQDNSNRLVIESNDLTGAMIVLGSGEMGALVKEERRVNSDLSHNTARSLSQSYTQSRLKFTHTFTSTNILRYLDPPIS